MQYKAAASFLALASAIPALVAAQSEENPYPSDLTSTTAYGTDGTFRLAIRSANPSFDGHSVQLVPVSPFSDVSQVAVQNSSAPVALFRLEAGVLKTLDRDNVNQAHEAGPVGGLRSVTSQGATSEFEFVTVNATSPEATPEFQDSSSKWYLSGYSGQYGLYQQVGTGISNGFLLCGASQSATYWYLLYTETTSTEGAEIPDYCNGGEFVGLQTVLAFDPKRQQ